MPRLIEVQDARAWTSPQTVKVGDVLMFRGTGGLIRSDDDVMELLGPFVGAVAGEGGRILTPTGPPNTVLFRARQPGRSVITLVTGDPFHTPKTTVLRITVEP